MSVMENLSVYKTVKNCFGKPIVFILIQDFDLIDTLLGWKYMFAKIYLKIQENDGENVEIKELSQFYLIECIVRFRIAIYYRYFAAV